MTVTRSKASGLATCKLCACRIVKGDDQITFTGWFQGACVHGNKRKCKKGACNGGTTSRKVE